MGGIVGGGEWGGVNNVCLDIHLLFANCFAQYHVTQMLCILHSFTDSFIHSFIRSFIHIHSYSFIHSFIHTAEHSYIERRRHLASGYGGLQSTSDGLQPTSDDTRSEAITATCAAATATSGPGAGPTAWTDVLPPAFHGLVQVQEVGTGPGGIISDLGDLVGLDSDSQREGSKRKTKARPIPGKQESQQGRKEESKKSGGISLDWVHPQSSANPPAKPVPAALAPLEPPLWHCPPAQTAPGCSKVVLLKYMKRAGNHHGQEGSRCKPQAYFFSEFC